VKVTTVEIKDVEIPGSMQQAMARQAEAERNRRAKVIDAEGEAQAADRLADAGDIIARNPTTLQLRYLQTLRDIGNNESSTIVFPLPLDLLRPLLESRPDAAQPQLGRAPDPDRFTSAAAPEREREPEPRAPSTPSAD
jgi:regulator of protease activity HflC (stomatin/prohibitin superfamily)